MPATILPKTGGEQDHRGVMGPREWRTSVTLWQETETYGAGAAGGAVERANLGGSEL